MPPRYTRCSQPSAIRKRDMSGGWVVTSELCGQRSQRQLHEDEPIAQGRGKFVVRIDPPKAELFVEPLRLNLPQTRIQSHHRIRCSLRRADNGPSQCAAYAIPVELRIYKHALHFAR